MNTSDANAVDTALEKEPRPALVRLFKRIGEVSALPSTATRIIHLVDQDVSRIDDLYEAIKTDPALAMRVLRRVNSAYYGLRNKISDLKTAIGLLGFREIRNLALTVHVSSLFQQPGDYRTYSRKGLWAHSVGVAAAARLVSIISEKGAADEAYVGGLLHDVGLILLDQHLRRHFRKVLDTIDETNDTTLIEQKVFSFDHAELGSYVTSQWSFPQQISDAIRYHHQPELYQGPFREMVYVISVANYLCCRAGWASLGVANVSAPPDEVYAGLNLDTADLRTIWDELTPTLDKVREMVTA